MTRRALRVSLLFLGLLIGGRICRCQTIFDAGATKFYIPRGHTSRVTALAFAPDGQMMVSGGYDGTLKIWNVQTARENFTVPAQPENIVTTLAVSRDGNLCASGDQNGGVHVYDRNGNLFTVKDSEGKPQPLTISVGTTRITSMAFGETMRGLKTVRFLAYADSEGIVRFRDRDRYPGGREV